MLYDEPRFLSAGECALVVEFGDSVSREANAKAVALAGALRDLSPAGVGEAVPSYRSVLVHYDPLRVGREALILRLQALLAEGLADRPVEPRRREIPTAYGGELGPDLASVAELVGLPEAEVVRLHAEQVYTVYMIGFLPGFPYLGLVPERIAVPRLEAPRLKVPAGSVAITGRQTGVYPVESPGGWRVIGRTPAPLFNPRRDPPTYLGPGDQVRFVPISAERFAELAGLPEAELWP